MGLMRSFFLWGSRSCTLREFLPRYGFMRKAVSRFMPGEDIENALNAAETLRDSRISTIVTHLGENLLDKHEAETVAHHYLEVLERIQKRRLDCHISLKLTQLGLDFSRDICVEHLSNIIERANAVGNVVWIDMESSPYVDVTLAVYRQMRSKFENVGVCVQSYLYRTAKDIDGLLPYFPSIRLVKGTYAEPHTVAFDRKRDVDDNFFTLSLKLLDAARNNTMRVGIATHDMPLLKRVFHNASQQGFSRDSFEVQMLYGIKREQQTALAKQGFKVRVLISYGSFWFPWYMRRLAERPANVLFVLKNLFSK
jgi:proline dehydrogenase